MHTDDLFFLRLHILAGTAQDGLDTRLDLQDVERFGHIVVRAVFEPQNFIHVFALGGEHDNRHIGLLADPLADLNAVQFGQHHIQQDKVNGIALKDLERLLAVRRGQDLIPLLLQGEFQPF